jgi:hypothetical protein
MFEVEILYDNTVTLATMQLLPPLQVRIRKRRITEKFHSIFPSPGFFYLQFNYCVGELLIAGVCVMGWKKVHAVQSISVNW